MKRGTDLSQTVATFIIQKILLDEEGLKYPCHTAERFFAVSTVLNNMVEIQLQKPSTRLLTIVIEMLKHNPKLTQNLDDSCKKLLQSLIDTLTHS